MKKNHSLLTSFFTFYKKELKRFMKVWGQTIVGPIITNSLFLLIFVVSIGRVAPNIHANYSYAQFIVPGLIMMTIIQNAFANSSSSLIIAKINGNIVDMFMAPLKPWMIILGYLLGAVTRGLMVSVCLLFYLMIFVDIPVHNIFVMLYFVISASAFLGLLGIIAGMVCIKFDQLAHFTNFVITPMSFLSGTFYSIKQLPETIQMITKYNPFFYMIDGFRYSFLGVSDFNLNIEFFSLLAINILLFILSVSLWSRGYKIKS